MHLYNISSMVLFTSAPQVRIHTNGFLLLILPSVASPHHFPTPLPKSHGNNLYHVGELCRRKCDTIHASSSVYTQSVIKVQDSQKSSTMEVMETLMTLYRSFINSLVRFLVNVLPEYHNVRCGLCAHLLTYSD